MEKKPTKKVLLPLICTIFNNYAVNYGFINYEFIKLWILVPKWYKVNIHKGNAREIVRRSRNTVIIQEFSSPFSVRNKSSGQK